MNWEAVVAHLRSEAQNRYFRANNAFGHTANPEAPQLRSEASVLASIADALEKGSK